MELKTGYKQTEIGVIPEEWSTTTLLQVADCLDNVRIPLNDAQRQRMQGDIPYCGANGVLDYVNDYVIDDDIILIAEDGGYFDQFATRPIAYRMSGKCWVNNHAHILKAKGGFDQGFLFYSLVHKNILPFLASGTRAKLNKSEMKRLVVPAPPTEAEQSAIGNALSEVDALLEGLDRLIAKKRDLKQAAMQQLLTGETRLAGFDGEWTPTRLGDHVTFLSHGTNSRAELRPDGSVKYLHYGDIHASTLARLEPASLPSLPEEKAKGLDRLRDGDLVFADASEDLTGVSKSVEIHGVEDTELVAGLHTIAARFDKGILADGFKAYLQFCPVFSSQLRRLAAGTKVYATNRSHIASVEMRLPGTDEQDAIAAVFRDMDAEIDALVQRRAKATDLKQAIMRELLTGKTRLVTPEAIHA